MSLVTLDYESVGWQARYEEMLHSWADKIRLKRYRLLRACIGEFFGTLILMYFGAGFVAQFRLNNDQGAISVSFGWGMAAFFGLIISGTMGYGLINPAFTLAFAFAGKVPWICVPILSLIQYFGAFVGALVAYFVYKDNILEGYDPGLTNKSGTIFVTDQTVGNIPAFYDQVIGTAILAALCVAIGDRYNFQIPRYLSPLYVGFVVYALVGAYGVNAGAALNPARDLGTRIALLAVGYHDAFKWSGGYFWVPIVGPYLGACIGTFGYEFCIGIHLRGVKEAEQELKLFGSEIAAGQ